MVEPGRSGVSGLLQAIGSRPSSSHSEDALLEHAERDHPRARAPARSGGTHSFGRPALATGLLTEDPLQRPHHRHQAAGSIATSGILVGAQRDADLVEVDVLPAQVANLLCTGGPVGSQGEGNRILALDGGGSRFANSAGLATRTDPAGSVGGQADLRRRIAGDQFPFLRPPVQRAQRVTIERILEPESPAR